LPNFKNFSFFWKYNNNTLTYIFNLARRQIQKKLCRPFKSSHFLSKFGQKWQKMRFSSIKMVKNIIFRLVSWCDHYTRWKAYTLLSIPRKMDHPWSIFYEKIDFFTFFVVFSFFFEIQNILYQILFFNQK